MVPVNLTYVCYFCYCNGRDNLQYLQNQKFAKQMEPIAGKFEVLRIEIGGVVMPLYDVIMGYIQEDFDNVALTMKFLTMVALRA